jgi:hypothetical protein
VPQSYPLTGTVPTSLTLRSPAEDDWPAMHLLAATSFTDFIGPESTTAWRTLVPADG